MGGPDPECIDKHHQIRPKNQETKSVQLGKLLGLKQHMPIELSNKILKEGEYYPLTDSVVYTISHLTNITDITIRL